MSDRRDVDPCGWTEASNRNVANGLDPLEGVMPPVNYHRARELWDEFTGKPPAPRFIWSWPDEEDPGTAA